jgi:hypothetical protein
VRRIQRPEQFPQQGRDDRRILTEAHEGLLNARQTLSGTTFRISHKLPHELIAGDGNLMLEWKRIGVKEMKIVLGLLLSTVLCAAEPANQAGTKPSNIQDGQAAEAYINKALNDFLEKPRYLIIVSETPFTLKRIAGKNVWTSLVDFYCGLSGDAKLHGETVIVYDPDTKQPRFLIPDDLKGV